MPMDAIELHNQFPEEPPEEPKKGTLLRPCQSCGRIPGVYSSDVSTLYYVECKTQLGGCGAKTASYPKKEDAIKQWNKHNEMPLEHPFLSPKMHTILNNVRIARRKDPKEYPQDDEPNEYRYISPAWLDAIAKGLTTGAVKHPGETWRDIPADEHLARAMRHINLYRAGHNTEENHIINASMRLMMAFETNKDD